MLTRAFAAIGLAVASVLLGAVPAIAAGPPVDCGSDAQWDGRQCKITATNPGRSGKTPLSGGGGSGESAPRTCAYGSIPMPCQEVKSPLSYVKPQRVGAACGGTRRRAWLGR